MNYDRWMKKLTLFKEFAEKLSTLSTCKRADEDGKSFHNGAIVFPTNFSHVSSIGYNGPACGRDNASCTGEIGACGCAHAEGNAAIKIAGGYNLIMYATTLPCQMCANYIVNCRKIKAVIYGKKYRSEEGHIVLRESGVLVRSYHEILAPDAEKIIHWKLFP